MQVKKRLKIRECYGEHSIPYIFENTDELDNFQTNTI